MPVNAPSTAIACVPAPAGLDAVVRTGVSATPLFANIAEELLRTVAEAGRARLFTKAIAAPATRIAGTAHPEMAVAG